MPDPKRLKAIPEANGLDVVVAMSPENFTYVSGAFVITVEAIRPRQAFAVLPRAGDPFAVFCSIETATMRDESWIEDLVEYTEFVHRPVDKLAEALTERGLGSGSIGIDLKYLPALDYNRLMELLPDAVLVDTTQAVAKVRAIKTEEEVGILEHAAKGTHSAVLDAIGASKTGDTEKQIAAKIADGITRNGADTVLFMCFGSGPRSILTHGAPGNRETELGDIIRLDTGGRYGAYFSDFARTYSAGDPTPGQREIYRKLVEVHKETIGAVRPGVTAEELFFICRDAFDKRGLPFHMPHIGHSFGVELHESPMLRPGDKTPIKAGMVINIEPVVVDHARKSLYHVEDLFVVTDEGFRLLTHGYPPEELPVLGERPAT
ncbi:MAG: Xaa-Pro peptidase family protein [Rhodobacteraceae bacterium]|nr:Xaa-Pro peptidase family protein [Paracoccaceae bacterium]